MSSLIPKLGEIALRWDFALAIAFILLISYFLIRNRKNVKLERMLFPILYAFLYRGKFGIKKMQKFVEKNKEAVKIFGYSSIGIGFVGMFLAIVLMAFVVFKLIFQPKVASVAPFLPFVEVPILGYISFSHWILTIFIVVIVHEAAHGIVAIAHGLKLKNTGFGLFAIIVPFLPAAFVEPDEKELNKKDPVVQLSIFAAGPVANFVLLIPLLLLMFLVVTPIESSMTYQDGFTFDVIQNETLPVYQAGIENGTAFNVVNGRQTEKIVDLYRELYLMKPGTNLSLGYISDGEFQYEYNLITIEHPDDEGSSFIGIMSMRDNVLLKESSKKYSEFFSWFKGLIILLIQITLSLGIINLFPASITDGGRMFSLTLNQISKNKKRNQRIIATLAIIFLAIILFAFITYFVGNPFALL